MCKFTTVRGFPTRMVCLHYILCLRYTILVGNKYKTHAYKTLKTACVQTIMLKYSTKQKKEREREKKKKKPLERQFLSHWYDSIGKNPHGERRNRTSGLSLWRRTP